jgi:hypothetical protein
MVHLLALPPTSYVEFIRYAIRSHNATGTWDHLSLTIVYNRDSVASIAVSCVRLLLPLTFRPEILRCVAYRISSSWRAVIEGLD